MSRVLWLLVLGIPRAALAAHLMLLWDFPRSYVPQPASFHIVYTSSAAPEAALEEMTVPPSAVGACATGTSAPEDTYCAVWPTCPAPGTVILFWVQAIWETVVSERSNIALCHFTAANPCECLDPGQDVLTMPALPTPQPLPPETTPQHWTDALAAVLSAAPSPGT